MLYLLFFDSLSTETNRDLGAAFEHLAHWPAIDKDRPKVPNIAIVITSGASKNSAAYGNFE